MKHLFTALATIILVPFLCGCSGADFKTARKAQLDGDYVTAARHWQELSDFGIPRAQVSLGRAYLKGEGVEKNPEQAFALFLRAAEEGDRVAAFELGRLYEKGLAAEKDGQRAAYYYRKSADQNYARGYYYLGRLYEKGDMIGKDLAQAEILYQKALSGGYQKAGDALERLKDNE